MLEVKLMEDYKDAMRSGNVIRKNTIQQLRAQILLEKKDKPDMTDVDIESVILKERGKRLEALAQFESAGRRDLIEQTNFEILYINEYLPKPMTDEELTECIKDVMQKYNVTEMKFMGFAIEKCREVIGNRATSKQISAIVRKLLSEDSK